MQLGCSKRCSNDFVTLWKVLNVNFVLLMMWQLIVLLNPETLNNVWKFNIQTLP